MKREEKFKTPEGNHMEGSWGARLPNRKKALANCRDDEGVAMCKANDGDAGVHKDMLLLAWKRAKSTDSDQWEILPCSTLKCPECNWNELMNCSNTSKNVVCVHFETG